jgi:hypothetical protein
MLFAAVAAGLSRQPRRETAATYTARGQAKANQNVQKFMLVAKLGRNPSGLRASNAATSWLDTVRAQSSAGPSFYLLFSIFDFLFSGFDFSAASSSFFWILRSMPRNTTASASSREKRLSILRNFSPAKRSLRAAT